MRHSFACVLSAAALAACLHPAAARADLVFFADRSAFNAANPGLATEDFEEARVGTGGAVTFLPPLSAVTDNAAFRPGEILPGVTIRTQRRGASSGGRAMLALGAGAVTGTSKIIGASTTGDADDELALLFDPGVSVIGVDLYSAFTFGPSLATPIDIDILGLDGSLLGVTTVNIPAVAGGFFGVFSTTALIGSIEINARDTNNGFRVELIDNLSFGSRAVPEPGSLALVAVGVAGLLVRARLRRPGR